MEKNNIKISVLLATRNRSEKLVNCLNSIVEAGKGNKNWELLVLVQGESDNVKQLAEKADNKQLRYFEVGGKRKNKIFEFWINPSQRVTDRIY